MDITISPSLLAADMSNLEQELKTVESCGIDSLHIDVMDGTFVPNIAFGPDQVNMLRPVSNMRFDVHMMVENPDRFIASFVDAGADCITVHAEACTHLHRSIQVIKSFGMKAGVALNPATPLGVLSYLYEMLDLVLIMTVNPGYGGQKNITAMNQKIKELANMKRAGGYSFEIQVDGGINLSNFRDVINAGATNIVIGSATFQKNKTKQNIEAFLKIVNEVTL
jgi:ribulose-phosphate 3-epimerase